MRGNQALSREWCHDTFMEYSEEYVVRKQLAARAIENFEILEESGMNVTEAVPIVQREQERFYKYRTMVDVVLDLYSDIIKKERENHGTSKSI